MNMFQFLYYTESLFNISFFECESYSFSSYLILLQQELSAGQGCSRSDCGFTAQNSQMRKSHCKIYKYIFLRPLYLDFEEGSLKGPKFEILGSEVFTQISPVWVSVT